MTATVTPRWQHSRHFGLGLGVTRDARTIAPRIPRITLGSPQATLGFMGGESDEVSLGPPHPLRPVPNPRLRDGEQRL